MLPSSASNKTMVNDISNLSILDLTIQNGFSLSGNDLTLENLFINGENNTIGLNVNMPTGPNPSINSNGENNVLNGNIVLSGTGTLDVAAYNAYNFVINGVISGNTGYLSLGGDGTVTTGTTNWTYTTSDHAQVTSDVTMVCRMSQCFGNPVNPVLVTSTKHVELATGGIDIANPLTLSASNPDSGGSITTPTTALGLPVYWSGDISLLENSKIGSSNSLNSLYIKDVDLNGRYLNFVNVGYVYQLDTGVISNAGNLEITTTGTESFVDLRGNNTYTGFTSVRNGSRVIVEHDNALGSTAGGTYIDSGGTISASSQTTNLQIPEDITVVGSGQGGTYSGSAFTNETNSSNNHTHSYSGTITLLGDTDIELMGTLPSEISFDGEIKGTGNLTFNGSHSSDVLVLNHSNTFNGNITVNGGVLGASDNSTIPNDITIKDSSTAIGVLHLDGTTNAISDDAKVSLDTSNGGVVFNLGSSTSETIGSLEGSGQPNVVLTPTSSLTINNPSGSQTTNDVEFTGGGTINKVGAGTQTLTGECTDEAQFNVTAGTLMSTSTFGSGTDCDATINGGTLKAAGEWHNITGTSGTFATGNSPGTVKITGDLSLSSTMNFEQEIDGATAGTQYDQTVVTGNVALNNATLLIDPSYNPAVGTVFNIVKADGNITGTFAGLADGNTVTANGLTFRINYTNNAVNLTYLSGTIPESASGTPNTGIQKNNIFRNIVILVGVFALTVLGVIYSEKKKKATK